MKNRKNNKGFSLVELIVVVAIMAVLVGVLAPAYLKYVEKSRVSKDVATVDEIMGAIEVAMADETINANTASAVIVLTGGTEVTFSNATGKTDLEKELAASVTSAKLTSNTLQGKNVNIAVTNTAGVVTVTAAFEVSVDGADKLNTVTYASATPTIGSNVSQ